MMPEEVRVLDRILIIVFIIVVVLAFGAGLIWRHG